MKITILPDAFGGDPQSVAMLQAFYSRSLEPIESRVERLGDDMSKVRSALKRYYVGYGHNSIADCGTVTVFVENVSIIAAKALQEDPLYNGQECSTRYIEMSGDNHLSGGEAASRWADLQKEVLEALVVGVRKLHPNENPDKTTEWENATSARAFDIARGWIPAAALTNLSLHMTIRKINDLTARLKGHPLPEVQVIAQAIKSELANRYPDSCEAEYREPAKEQARWLSTCLDNWYIAQQIRSDRCTVDILSLLLTKEELGFINERPKYASLPTFFEKKASFKLLGVIDYGTWRDLQRHRRNVGAPPMLTDCFGFNEWYLARLFEYLPGDSAEAFRLKTNELIRQDGFKGNAIDQYLLPMGMNVYFEYTFGLAQALYFAELRSGNTVHPILRPFAQLVARVLEGQGIRMYYDTAPARFDLKRGTQTITQMPTQAEIDNGPHGNVGTIPTDYLTKGTSV